MLLYKRFGFLFYLLFFGLIISAQEKKQIVTLKSILITIEKQHQVTFNYTEDTVINIQITPPDYSLDLGQKLNYLEKTTPLLFENINNKFINIYRKKNNEAAIICGYVFSKIDNSPLENVNIILADGSRITTNSKGYFEYKKSINNTFWMSHIGYLSKTITPTTEDLKNCLNLILSPQITELAEIKTNPILAFGISKNTNGSYEIKPKKFGILPGLIEPDALQTMEQIPGVSSIDESVASINVRGGTHDQNLFLWNGIRMYQTGHFFGLISVFNPNLPHTITINKNGSSPFFGESVSSVVTISSVPENFEKNTFSAGLNMINGDIYSKFNLSKNSFLEVSGRKSITEFLETPTYKEYFNKIFQNSTITDYSSGQYIDFQSDRKFDFYDATLKYFLKIGQKDQVILDFITIKDNLKVVQNAITNSTSLSEKNELQQTNLGANLFWKRNWNSLNTTKINIYTSNYELLANKTTSDGDQNVIQQNAVQDNGIALENSHILTSKITFNNGYQFNEIGIENLDQVDNPDFYQKIKEVLRTHALILEGKYNDSISKLHLNIGFRLNYIEKFNKFIPEPRLQLNYELCKNLNLEVLGEFKSQNTNQVIDLHNDYFGIEKRRWILSNNSDIPVQESAQFSVGLFFKKNDWLFNIENFYKKVEGISSSSQGFQNQLEFTKISGNYEVYGTEILIQKKLNHFLTWLTYTYNENNYQFLTFEPSIFSNNFEMIHNISWAGIYERNNFKIALGAKWTSGRPKTTPLNTELNATSPEIIYNIPNNTYLNSFFQVNFSSTYKWESAKGIQYKLGISVLNVLNKKNEISEYYRISPLTNSIQGVETYALERTPNMSFRIHF